jgi:hypothetical protein
LFGNVPFSILPGPPLASGGEVPEDPAVDGEIVTVAAVGAAIVVVVDGDDEDGNNVDAAKAEDEDEKAADTDDVKSDSAVAL